MAGFAIFMSIATYGIVALIAAAILTGILRVLAAKRGRDGVRGHGAMIVATWAPFVAFLWVVVAFLIHVEISSRIAHQDSGLSGDPYVTLPNGYVLGSYNTYDGYIEAPGHATGEPIAGPGYVRSIVDLELSDPYFIGTQFDFKTSHIRKFIFDTRTLEFRTSGSDSAEASRPTASPDLNAWGDAMTHAQRDSNSYWHLYRRYRHTWPRYVFIILLIGGEAGIALWTVFRWNSRTSDAVTSHARSPV